MKTSSKNKDELRMVTGVAWYRANQWQRLREVAEDVENLEERYEAWLHTAERMIIEAVPCNMLVEKVDVDVEVLLAWCNERGLPVTGESRSRYVSEILREKYKDA